MNSESIARVTKGAALYGALMAFFACASVADAWPQYTAYAMAAGAAIVALVPLALFTLGRLQKSTPDAKVADQDPDARMELLPSRVNFIPSNRAGYLHFMKAHEGEWLAYLRRLEMDETVYRPRASEPLNRFIPPSILPPPVFPEAPFDRYAAPLAHGRPAALSIWEFIDRTPESFRVAAGTFVIDYRHGKSHIWVLDSSNVTVSNTDHIPDRHDVDIRDQRHGAVIEEAFPTNALGPSRKAAKRATASGLH